MIADLRMFETVSLQVEQGVLPPNAMARLGYGVEKIRDALLKLTKAEPGSLPIALDVGIPYEARLGGQWEFPGVYAESFARHKKAGLFREDDGDNARRELVDYTGNLRDLERAKEAKEADLEATRRALRDAESVEAELRATVVEHQAAQGGHDQISREIDLLTLEILRLEAEAAKSDTASPGGQGARAGKSAPGAPQRPFGLLEVS